MALFKKGDIVRRIGGDIDGIIVEVRDVNATTQRFKVLWMFGSTSSVDNNQVEIAADHTTSHLV